MPVDESVTHESVEAIRKVELAIALVNIPNDDIHSAAVAYVGLCAMVRLGIQKEDIHELVEVAWKAVSDG